jgi:hypothetical protein
LISPYRAANITFHKFVIDVPGKRVRVPALSVYAETQFEFDFAVVFKVVPGGKDGRPHLPLDIAI